MIDIQFIRDNPSLVKEKAMQKGYPVDIDGLLKVDESRRKLLIKIDETRELRNKLAAEKSKKPSQAEIEKGKKLKLELAYLEDQLGPINHKFQELLQHIPNMPLDKVPIGASEDDNVVEREEGVRREFNFKPKTHWQIGEARDLIDKERATKVAGARFVYLKGDLVLLQLALVQFVMQRLTDETWLEAIIKKYRLSVSAKPFVPVAPPALVNTEAYEATGRLDKNEMTYKLEDGDLWLNASAEHSLCNMYMNEIISEENLPLRYVAYLTSFRKEAGSYGKDTEGIIRMHQFDKLEMEVFSTPATGLDEHKFLVAIEEQLTHELDLPYRVIQKCTADIGKPNANGIDIEMWMPGQDKYRETHSADYMTDYQARRLRTKLRRKNGAVELVHTNDATAFALPRTLVAIMENNQTQDGRIRVPEVLKQFMNGKEEL